MLILIPAIILFFSFVFLNETNNNLSKSVDENVIVKKVYKNGFITNVKNQNVFVNYKNFLEMGDLINLKSSEIRKVNVRKSDFEKFLRSENVKYIIDHPEIKYIGTYNSLSKTIQDYLIRGPTYYSRYVPLLLLGLRYSKNEPVVNKIKNISIIHLFTISGFHINIIIFIFIKFIKKIKKQNKYLFLIPIFVVFPYLLIMNFPLAATRAFIFSVMTNINKYFLNNKIHLLNILSSIMLLFFILNPFVIYSLSFIFSFTLTFAIIMVSNFKKKSKLLSCIYLWIFSILINLYLNDEINITSFVANIFFSPIISFSYILTFLFFWLKDVVDNYYLLIDVLINIFQKLKISVNLSIDTSVIFTIGYSLFFWSIIYLKKPLNDEFNQNNWWNKIKNNYNYY